MSGPDRLELDDALPESFEHTQALKDMGVSTVTDMATQLMSKQTALREQGARVPGERASEAEWKEFHQKLGAGKEASDYAIPESGAELKSVLENLRTKALDSGMTKKQWEGLAGEAVRLDTARGEQLTEAIKTNRDSWETEFRQKCAADGRNADDVIAKAQAGYDTLYKGNAAFAKIMDITGLGSAGFMLEHFANVSEIINPDGTPSGLEGEKVSDTSFEELRKLAHESRGLAAKDGWADRTHAEYQNLQHTYQANHLKLIKAGFQGCMDDKFNNENIFQEFEANELAALKRQQRGY